MKMRFAGGVSLAIALALVMPASGAMASESSETAGVKWTVGKASPFAGTRFDGATVGKKVYFLGFRAADDSTDGSIWYYDIKKDKYVDTGDKMAAPVTNYTIAVLTDKTGTGLYTFGGRSDTGETSTTVQVYYPASGKSQIIKSDPWPGTTLSGCASLPATGVTVVGNLAYVMGGASFSTSIPPCTDDQSNQVWSFDPKAKSGKMWKAQPNLAKARGYISPAVVGGNTIIAIGGDVNDAGTLVAQSTVEGWKVGAKKWDDKGYADLPTACDETQSFAFDKGKLGGTVTLAGCGQWPNALPDVQQYTVKSDSWKTVGALNEARRNQAGANIGSNKKPKLFLLGGYSGDASTVLMSSEVGTAGKAITDGVVVTPPSGGSSGAGVPLL